ncbi:MAG: hypothetical protein K2K84_05615, partial [Muribaculaceae bacterium]|nr:hypothetical protein [Muribaculaceae bacterium]
FYTDSFIHIVKSDRIIEGYGFTANEQMTEYTIHHPTAIIPASSLRGDERDVTETPADSTIPGSEPIDPDVRMRRAPQPASIRNIDRDLRNEGRASVRDNDPRNLTADPSLKR